MPIYFKINSIYPKNPFYIARSGCFGQFKQFFYRRFLQSSLFNQFFINQFSFYLIHLGTSKHFGYIVVRRKAIAKHDRLKKNKIKKLDART